MLRATVMKSANVSRCPSSPMNSSGRIHPSPNPKTSGTTRLPAATNTDERPSEARSLRSVSKPVTTSRKAAPIQETARRSPLCTGSAGKSQAYTSGASPPSTDGPTIRPAASSPTTAGWP
jgi:hypothetical protein